MPCKCSRQSIGATLPLRPISKRKDDLDHKGLAGHGVGLFGEEGWVQLAYALGRHGRRKAQLRGLRTISAFLRELDGGDGPLSIVACDRNSQAVPFVKQNRLHGPGLSVREDYGLADKLGLGLLELAEDRGRTDLRSWHGVSPESELGTPGA
jgi:hypothetical protein